MDNNQNDGFIFSIVIRVWQRVSGSLAAYASQGPDTSNDNTTWPELYSNFRNLSTVTFEC